MKMFFLSQLNMMTEYHHHQDVKVKNESSFSQISLNISSDNMMTWLFKMAWINDRSTKT